MQSKIAFAFLMGMTPAVTLAQGISESSIVGQDMEISQVEGSVDAAEVESLIQGAAATANKIRMLVAPESVTVVQLGERRAAVTDEIEGVLEANAAPLADLRNAMQINAVLVEVFNQRGVGVPEIIAANVTEDNAVIVYAFAEQ